MSVHFKEGPGGAVFQIEAVVSEFERPRVQLILAGFLSDFEILQKNSVLPCPQSSPKATIHCFTYFRCALKER
jgi:hypothetical protein